MSSVYEQLLGDIAEKRDALQNEVEALRRQVRSQEQEHRREKTAMEREHQKELRALDARQAREQTDVQSQIDERTALLEQINTLLPTESKDAGKQSSRAPRGAGIAKKQAAKRANDIMRSLLVQLLADHTEGLSASQLAEILAKMPEWTEHRFSNPSGQRVSAILRDTPGCAYNGFMYTYLKPLTTAQAEAVSAAES